jgi:hypothetical protein
MVGNGPSTDHGRATLQNRENALRAGRVIAPAAAALDARFPFCSLIQWTTYPNAHLEMRQGARIILKSKEEPRC